MQIALTYLCVAQNLNLPLFLTIQCFFITGIRQEQAGSFAFPANRGIVRQHIEDMETEVFLPDFGDGQEQRPIGIWGQRHLRYIREHRIALYTELLTSGRLNAYLANLNEEAEAMLSRLVKELAEKEGVTEKLKAEDGMKWVQAMNNIRNRAAEVVYNDLIYN